MHACRRPCLVLKAAWSGLVVGVGRYKHITPALCDVLHWLPVPQRIQFKIKISVFDCVREHCPAYFNNVCIPVAGISSRENLRSAERHDMLLLVPSTRTARLMEFPRCSPSCLECASITAPLIINQSWTV